LKTEGVRSCLPHLQDCDVKVAVREYHSIKKGNYALLEKNYGVLALRLGNFRPSPFRPLSRTEISSLAKILTPQKCLQYLTKIASGSFAHVYKFKPNRCQGLHHILHVFYIYLHSQSKHLYHADLCQQMSAPNNIHLKATIQTTAVKMLKLSISKSVRAYELNAAKTIGLLPEHYNVLREQIVRPGVTISRLYDETLGSFIKSKMSINPSRRVGLECILMAVAGGVAHLHDHHLGHFDIKPSNILINWASQRGFFTGTTVVIADFGLTRELSRGK